MNNKSINRRRFLVKSITALSAVYVVPDLFPKAMAAKPFDQKLVHQQNGQ